jgi:ribose 5-phosphate isomerase B
MEAVKVAIANDHAGYQLKLLVAAHIRGLGHEVSDLGSHNTEPVDYPPYCAACAREVVGKKADFGVVIGGSGQGEQIAANKVHGARAALCHDEYTARFARMHNDANVLALGARILAPELACDVVDVFLATAFQGGRHQVRVDELAEIEAEEAIAWLAAQKSGRRPWQEAAPP